MQWVWSLLEAKLHMKQVAILGHVTWKESTRFCHAPTGWLAVETPQNVAALNVDYSASIITVLEGI